MMEKSFPGSFRLSSLDRRGDDRRRGPRLPATVWLSHVRTLDPIAPHGSFLWASPDMPTTKPAPPRIGTERFTLLAAIRRIVAALRLWRWRARAQQQLRELSDHMLKDIGLRREDVGYEFPQPFWHCD